MNDTNDTVIHIYADFYFERKRVKDSQKSKLYAAEQNYLRLHPADHYLGDIDACQKFVDKVLARKYVQKHYRTTPGIKVVGIPTKRRWAHAYNSAGRIELGTGDRAKWSRSNSVVLHEIAHILAYRTITEHIGSHDWGFASVFLDLVRNVMGPDAAKALKLGYKINKVRTSPPRHRNMTVEQKDAAAARLELARAKREAVLAPKRLMKERALKLHHKDFRGYNSFGNKCYEHFLMSHGRSQWIPKSPQYMSYAEIEKSLKLFDAKFKAVDPFLPQKVYDPYDHSEILYQERMRLQLTKPYAILAVTD